MADALLEVRDLKTEFVTGRGTARAVDGVSFRLERGRTLGIVGESGCGKSVTALSILRLIQSPGRVAGGQVLLEGRDLLTLPEREMRAVRGKRIAMIFQEPMTALNPVFTIGNQIGEAITVHERVGRREVRARTIELLRLVGIPSPETRIGEYPNQLSGGQRQRAMIAMALACNPQILIADEPTTALDVTIQAQILELLADLRARLGMSVILITHDLGVVAEYCDDVAVMYAGSIVERSPARELFANPRHPYTAGLLQSVPTPRSDHGTRGRLASIPGIVPDLVAPPAAAASRIAAPWPRSGAETSSRSSSTSAPGTARCWYTDAVPDLRFESDAREARVG